MSDPTKKKPRVTLQDLKKVGGNLGKFLQAVANPNEEPEIYDFDLTERLILGIEDLAAELKKNTRALNKNSKIIEDNTDALYEDDEDDS
jgi:hypothetical protein